ncbi:excalibur calcium-binding domain-containing protein [Novosphingobium profundi]|uniref:excalibur calcium-binding domain-containing protein n=1 Tax=Novosphingobium profundi TaxID=1774954 RepID=UPI001BDB043D|nr:excalibur calcium-binding domain-containing protein [Novosphingobium profundi]MBT0670346.1 excalibur calcium-binding domain-containing protein [Novosphingobium profundi]
MKRIVPGLALFGAAALTCTGAAKAHPGGLDRSGCHNERRTGTYHCHRAPAPRTLAAPARPSSDGAAYYPNCTAVRAAGRAPLRRGEAGYRADLDRDGDGIACE